MRTTSAQTGIKLLTWFSDDKGRELHVEHENMQTEVHWSPFCHFIHQPNSDILCIFCCCSVAKSCPTLCNPMDCSAPGSPGLYHCLELAQTHVQWVSGAIPPSHPVIPFSSCLQSFPAHFYIYFSIVDNVIFNLTEIKCEGLPERSRSLNNIPVQSQR